MRFYEIKEAIGDTFPIRVFKAMQSAEDEAERNRLANLSNLLGITPAGVEPSTTPPTGEKNTTINPNIKSVSGGVNPNSIASYLKTKGLDNNHIIGILTNIKGESGFQPGVIGDGNTSGGLFQHHGPRFSNMIKAVGSDWQTDWKGQIDFALSEPAGAKYTRMAFNSPQAATEWWTRNFEVPKYADADVQKRVGFISQFT